MAYDNNNRGSIWKNDKKEKDTHPDFTGSAVINGVEGWVSAWKRKPDANDKAPALTFTFKPKEGNKQQPSRIGGAGGAGALSNDMNDDIPF